MLPLQKLTNLASEYFQLRISANVQQLHLRLRGLVKAYPLPLIGEDFFGV